MFSRVKLETGQEKTGGLRLLTPHSPSVVRTQPVVIYFVERLEFNNQKLPKSNGHQRGKKARIKRDAGLLFEIAASLFVRVNLWPIRK